VPSSPANDGKTQGTEEARIQDDLNFSMKICAGRDRLFRTFPRDKEYIKILAIVV
jgi:hypothetical protein